VQARQVLQCSHGRVAGQTGLLVQSAPDRRGYGDLSLRGPALGLQQLNRQVTRNSAWRILNVRAPR
jgi:hypothetical protein